MVRNTVYRGEAYELTECILRWVHWQPLVWNHPIPTAPIVDSLKDLGADQRYDHKVAVAHKAIFGCCFDRFVCWKVPHSMRPEALVRGLLLRRGVRVGAYKSRYCCSAAWWEVTGSENTKEKLRLEVSMAPKLILSIAGRCWADFQGLCKTGRCVRICICHQQVFAGTS